MKSRIAFGLAATLALAAGLVIAQPEKGKSPAQPEVTPEQQAQMDAWMKAATPGEFHKHIAQFAGDWDGTIKHRQDPAAPWQESATSCRAKMEWGGRYLRSKWKSDMMGQEFHGEGVWAYNNITKRNSSAVCHGIG